MAKQIKLNFNPLRSLRKSFFMTCYDQGMRNIEAAKEAMDFPDLEFENLDQAKIQAHNWRQAWMKDNPRSKNPLIKKKEMMYAYMDLGLPNRDIEKITGDNYNNIKYYRSKWRKRAIDFRRNLNWKSGTEMIEDIFRIGDGKWGSKYPRVS